MTSIRFEQEPEPDSGRNPMWDGNPVFDRRIIPDEPEVQVSQFAANGAVECGNCGTVVTLDDKEPHRCLGQNEIGKIRRIGDEEWALILYAQKDTPQVTYFKMPDGNVVREAREAFAKREDNIA